MSEKINNPLTKYYDGKFEKQVQEAPAIQGKMQPVPDCGEESYTFLAVRAVPDERPPSPLRSVEKHRDDCGGCRSFQTN